MRGVGIDLVDERILFNRFTFYKVDIFHYSLSLNETMNNEGRGHRPR